ncbi:CLUMA_CG017284, isoform A [Clunio marinus]|uniref:CLUMA_CG017284, isoform A n=1 Tax=Clunio marinus TaxID=568069 RepID=A0A1J1IVP4_9DIPT|nr:CLUMA_CG017284, isoform A [Clunio marinus]
MPVGGRLAGKTGYSSGYSGQGRSYNDINEEIYYLSIFMASLIAILICMALCYIAYEKYHKKREYFINV